MNYSNEYIPTAKELKRLFAVVNLLNKFQERARFVSQEDYEEWYDTAVSLKKILRKQRLRRLSADKVLGR